MRLSIYIMIFINFIFLGSTVFADTSKISKDPLDFYDSFWSNRILKNIEAQQKQMMENKTQVRQIFSIQTFEQNLLDLLLRYPENIFLHYNLGVLWLFEDMQKSAQQFLSVLGMHGPDDIKFRAAFNLGNLYGYAKDFKVSKEAFMRGYRIHQALKYYQIALDLYPQSQEVKHNIELLFVRSVQQQQSQQGDNGDQDSREGDSDQEQDSKKSDRKNRKYRDPRQDREQQQDAPRQLAPGDVKAILEELKQQEQQIWEKLIQEQDKKQRSNQKDSKNRMQWLFEGDVNEGQSKDSGLDKDW